MKKYLLYALKGEEMCFIHVLLNALDLKDAGNEVKIIFEGASVKLPVVFEEKNKPFISKPKSKVSLPAFVRRVLRP